MVSLKLFDAGSEQFLDGYLYIFTRKGDKRTRYESPGKAMNPCMISSRGYLRGLGRFI